MLKAGDWDGIASWWPAAERKCYLETVMSRLEGNTQLDTGEQNRTDIGVWSHRVYTGHAGVRQVSGAQYASAASDRDRTSVYHWLHELPSSTLVATCWWLINYDNQVLLPASSSRISCRRVLWRVETIYVICLSNLCKLKCWIWCGSESAFM